MEPKNFVHGSVFEECGDSFLGQTAYKPIEDEGLRQKAEDAYIFWLSRSWTDKMIPVLDMYNHRNGVSKNVESTTAHFDDGAITAFALRDIESGEQLQNTYSECMDEDCAWGEMQYTYLTQQIYVDYGFLELYPRRWLLGTDESDVIAEVDQDLRTGRKSFKWIFETPSEAIFQWISHQLKRLRSIDANVRDRISKHRTKGAGGKALRHNIQHEADSLVELYEGYIEILEMALEHKDGDIGVTREQFAQDLQNVRKETQSRYDEL